MTDFPTVLITGGAGYIGSHAVLAFREAGFSVVVLDDLSTGRRDAVSDDVPFVLGDVGEPGLVRDLIVNKGIGAVVHFAGSIVVPESVANPLKYYANNTVASRTLIDACVECGVKNFIFSSTAAVYGIPETVPASEDTPTVPINPYGASKLMTEWMLRDVAAAHDFNYIALRYFNVAGADPDGRVGQSTPGATHLIKVAVQTALEQRDYIEIYGDDYNTDDGTCVRDYIHVSDLVDAHVDALKHLLSNRKSLVMNCGYGRGFSVKDVLASVEKVAEKKLHIKSAPRRAGDAGIIISNPERIMAILSWRPRYQDLDFIVKTALDWERRLI